MSGKKLSSKSLAYHGLVWTVVVVIMAGATGCGEVVSQPQAPLPQVTAGPSPTATVQPSPTPAPTPTPTEIPIILPTATPPNQFLPPTQPFYQPAFTPGATTTPIPTPTQSFTATPYNPPRVVPLGIYSSNILGPYYRLDYFPPPVFTTQCIAEQYFNVSGTPIPAPTSSSSGQVNGLALAADSEWLSEFETRWFSDQRLNSFRIPAATFTPIPTNTPVPTATPLPYNTADVFVPLTPRPADAATVTPAPTATFRVPTWTPTLVQKFQTQGSLTSNTIGSIFISDVNSLLPRTLQQPINFVAMWQVMNDLTYALVNADTPFETFLRGYEERLDLIFKSILNRSLKDPRLAPSGEERYANRKIIIGNVPDLRAFRFYKACFTAERIKTVQTDFNSLISRLAAKYPGQVYVADLAALDWLNHPQWVFIGDGYRLSRSGASAVGDVFGQLFVKLNF